MKEAIGGLALGLILGKVFFGGKKDTPSMVTGQPKPKSQTMPTGSMAFTRPAMLQPTQQKAVVQSLTRPVSSPVQIKNTLAKETGIPFDQGPQAMKNYLVSMSR